MEGRRGKADGDDGNRRANVLVIVIRPAEIDDVLRALSHRRRRYVMYYMQDRKTGSIEELARYVAAVDEDIPIDDVSEDLREQYRISLRHNDLPELAEAGLVDYDPRSGDVRFSHPSTFLEKLLAVSAEIEQRDAVSNGT